MSINYRTAQATIKARRDANKKRSLSTYAAKVTATAKDAKGLTAALRKVAKKLRENGTLGKVQTVIRRIAGAARKGFRYTAANVATIAAAYAPRAAAYKAAKAQLVAA